MEYSASQKQTLTLDEITISTHLRNQSEVFTIKYNALIAHRGDFV